MVFVLTEHVAILAAGTGWQPAIAYEFAFVLQLSAAWVKVVLRAPAGPGLGRRGDVLVGLSTSGNSPSVIRAVEAAKSRRMISIGMLGRDGGKLRDVVDIPIVVPHNVTARIQEVHIFILHFWAAVIERQLFFE